MKPIFLLTILAGIILFSNCARPVKVEGNAMLPNFKDGDRILMNNNLGDLKRGDVIYFKYPKDETKTYFKRIIGLPGEKIEVRSGAIFINGQVLEEPYVDQSYNQMKSSYPEKNISPDNYFVLGDNRDNSSDSRIWGTVQKDLILGKYYATYLSADKK